jgi:hypothetical protein
MQLFTGFEADCLAWGNRDLGTRSWVAANAGFAWFYGEDAESAQLNPVARDEGLLHALEDGVYGGFCFCPRQAGALNNPLYKILLNHLGRRPWAVILRRSILTWFSNVIVETRAEIVNGRTLP